MISWFEKKLDTRSDSKHNFSYSRNQQTNKLLFTTDWLEGQKEEEEEEEKKKKIGKQMENNNAVEAI